MPSFYNQRISIPLFGNPATGLPTEVQSHIYVPQHTHYHGSFSGLTEDHHPQYLTDFRGSTLIQAWLAQLGLNSPNVVKNGINIGTGIGVFFNNNSGTLQFKSLSAGSGITITQNDTTIFIEANIDDGEY